MPRVWLIGSHCLCAMLIKYVLNTNNIVMHQVTHISPTWMHSLWQQLNVQSTHQHNHTSLFKGMVYCSTQAVKPLSTCQKPWFDPRDLWWAKWLFYFSPAIIIPLVVQNHISFILTPMIQNNKGNRQQSHFYVSRRKRYYLTFSPMLTLCRKCQVMWKKRYKSQLIATTCYKYSKFQICGSFKITISNTANYFYS
jgi:hypothetical protein